MKNFEDKSLKDLNYNNGQIDLSLYLAAIWQGKLLITIISSLFLIATIIYSFSLPDIYQSRTILSPVGDERNISGAARTYSGIANLAGINLPSQSSGSKSAKALRKINSFSFFDESIFHNIFLPDLMAAKYWDPASNKVIYDENIYNIETQTWVRDFNYPQTLIPDVNESYLVFKELFQVSQDDEGFVTIVVKHKSPFIAQKWVEIIVNEVNHFFRVKDKVEAQAAAQYLNIQMAQTNFTEIKEVIAQLLQEKTQQLALIEVSDFYVFEYIDPPAVFLESNEPARALYCILGALFGAIIGILVVLIRYFSFPKNN